MRNIPDVAAVADPLTGVAVYSALNGGWIQIGGTSASAPIWAGYFSIINSARQKIGLPNLGFANPYLYYLALTAGRPIVLSDDEVMRIVLSLQHAGVLCHIASNQQASRARHMSEVLNYRTLFTREFYSCALGVAKPDIDHANQTDRHRRTEREAPSGRDRM